MSEEIDIVGMDDLKEALEVAYDYMKFVDDEWTNSGGKRGEPMDDELEIIRRALSIWGK